MFRAIQTDRQTDRQTEINGCDVLPIILMNSLSPEGVPQLIPEEGSTYYHRVQHYRELLDSLQMDAYTHGCILHPEITVDSHIPAYAATCIRSKITLLLQKDMAAFTMLKAGPFVARLTTIFLYTCSVYTLWQDGVIRNLSSLILLQNTNNKYL